MSRTKQLIILVVFLLFVFGLTGCKEHEFDDSNKSIVSLPTHKAKILDALLESDDSLEPDANFSHLLVPKFNKGNIEIEVVGREGKDDKGKDLFSIKAHSGTTIQATTLKGLSSYSFTSVNGIKGYRNCNYINVGSKTELICQRIENSEYQSSETEKVKQTKVFNYLEQNIGEESPFIILANVNGEPMTVINKNAGYDVIPPEKFDPKVTVETIFQNVTQMDFKGSPCCCIVETPDRSYEVCGKKKC